MSNQPTSVWGAYVLLLREYAGLTQTEFAQVALGAARLQGKVSRWEGGGAAPNRAADVAAFARALGRNPLEAFVAAGMLSIDEAGRGLDAESRTMLLQVGDRLGFERPSSEAAPNLALVADQGDLEPGDLEES